MVGLTTGLNSTVKSMWCVKKYKDKKKLKAYIKRNRERYYHSGDYRERGQRKRNYTIEEDYVVMYSDETDRTIAKELLRSIRSVQIRRHRLLHGKVKGGLVLTDKTPVFKTGNAGSNPVTLTKKEGDEHEQKK